MQREQSGRGAANLKLSVGSIFHNVKTELTSAASLAQLSYDFIESTPVDLHRLSLAAVNGHLQAQLRASESARCSREVVAHKKCSWTVLQLHVSGMVKKEGLSRPRRRDYSI